jgi:arylsulfatase A-like enzyme
LRQSCGIVDQPIGALIQDLKQRGLLDDTLVVWGTEFGRTPVTQNSDPGPGAGRDHHRFAFSTWMAGGGVKGGQVIGRTDEFGWKPVDTPVHVNDFHASLLHLLGLDQDRLTYRFKGLDFRLTNQGGKIIERLFT